jgi:ankyrin repeat protein
MLSNIERKKTIEFINSLQIENGAFKANASGSANPQSTLSGIKALQFLGKTVNEPDKVYSYITSLYDDEKSSFVDPGTKEPNVFLSAAGLLILFNIGADNELERIYHKTLDQMIANAKIREENFMIIGVVDECKIAHDISKPINFFKNMESSGKFGDSVLNNAIASSALWRINETAGDTKLIIDFLLNSQTDNGGFREDSSNPDLWITYCVMRALDLKDTTPSRQILLKWILENYNENGGYGKDEADLNITYQSFSILDWCLKPVFNAAKNNDTNPIEEWICEGGSPNVYDLKGFTPLLKASARGCSEVVEYLLSDELDQKADPKIKYEEADASPLFLAGQSGNLHTVQYLMNSNKDQLFDISKVNGHNLLLQAAFYGSEGHYQIAEWILENIASILNISKEYKENYLIKLMKMTNVRGYNCTTMNELWGNQKMGELFKKYDKTTEKDRLEYLDDLLEKIANPIPENAIEKQKQELTEAFIDIIDESLKNANSTHSDINNLYKETTLRLSDLIQKADFDINRKGGPLSETPVIVAVTGVDSTEEASKFRYDLVKFLLENGADPDIEEEHPMAVDAVIRAAVLNHFDILKLISEYMPPLKFAAALNAKPAINGQTALQDTVHRALTAKGDSLQTHLEQLDWAISRGAKVDIEDHTGKSPLKLAESALNDKIFKENAQKVLHIINEN